MFRAFSQHILHRLNITQDKPKVGTTSLGKHINYFSCVRVIPYNIHNIHTVKAFRSFFLVHRSYCYWIKPLNIFLVKKFSVKSSFATTSVDSLFALTIKILFLEQTLGRAVAPVTLCIHNKIVTLCKIKVLTELLWWSQVKFDLLIDIMCLIHWNG